MRTAFSVRFDEELTNKIDLARGEKSRTNFIEDILIKYFDEPLLNQSEPQSDAQSEPHVNPNEAELVPVLKEEIEYLRKKLDESTVVHNQEKLELLRLLNQSQILQMQAQKQLTEAQEIKIKTLKWWQFWKK